MARVGAQGHRRKREIFDTKVMEKIKTHFIRSINFSPEIVPFMR